MNLARWSRTMVTWGLRHRVWATIVGTIFIGAPAIVAVVSLFSQRWYPTGDVSHTELMLRSIPRHVPLIGVAARVGEDLNNQGSTPGASMAYILYPVYALFLRSSAGMVVSVLVVHLLAIGSSLYIFGRFGGRRAVLAFGVVLALVVRSLAPRFFLEPWNVWVPLFAFALFLLVIWLIVLGRHGFLPVATAIGIHCVQTHISYVPLVGGLLVLTVALIGFRQWKPKNGAQSAVVPFALSAGVIVVMWLPPVIEQLRPGPGNLGRLWRHFSQPSEETVGIMAALKAMAGELNLAGPFITGPGHAPYDAPHIGGLVAFIAIVAVGIVVAWRLREQRILALQGVLGVSTLIGLFAAARVFGQFYDYVIRWMWILAVLWVAVSLWAILERISGEAIRQRVSAVLVGVAFLATVWGTASSVGAHPPYKNDSRLVGGLAGQLEKSIDPTLDYLLRWHDPAALGGTGFGLVLEMEKRSTPLFVDSWAAAAARPHRVRAVENTDVVLCLVVGPENIDRFRARSSRRELGYFDPRTPDEQVESDTLRSAIEEFLRQRNQEELIARMDSQYGHMQILLAPDTPQELFILMDRYSEIRLPGALFEAPQGSLCLP